ncbi:hypothetical protein ACFVFI_11510 [Streptomyces sp. NPDC057705]|uniref:hypothetical protein n=1 Tax=Streptomyces sp. NPDC057705 TaxID=3346222 RepID=UPI0036CF8C7E
MPNASALAASSALRAHCVGQLNSVLRRPGAYGDLDTAVWFLMDHLLVVEKDDPGAWAAEQSRLTESGAWYADGVQGAFEKLLRLETGRDVHAASVYAEFAHRRGWLTLDRTLSKDEYDAVRGALHDWCAADRDLPDAVTAFGEPSVVFGSANPRTGKALAYATTAPEDPMLVLHLWNDYGSGRTQPAVLAARIGGDLLPESFTFTPFGRLPRPSGEESG